MHPLTGVETVGWGRLPPSSFSSLFFLFFLLLPLVSMEFLVVGVLSPTRLIVRSVPGFIVTNECF
jgi:hypothetical protein